MGGDEENCHGKLVPLNLAPVFAIELKNRCFWVCSDQNHWLYLGISLVCISTAKLWLKGFEDSKKECLKMVSHSQLSIPCKNKGAFLRVLVL